MLRSHRRVAGGLRCDCAAAVTGMADIVPSSGVWCVPAACRALAIVAASVGLVIWVPVAWVTFTAAWRTRRFGFPVVVIWVLTAWGHLRGDHSPFRVFDRRCLP
ncbi:hypothetical protein ZEAMMB73_Zm00001d006522 [Zea mays]|uniref:Uncharacterized protein n=1 Tax=Zea mays TaxID=4577 RepID=A0A1D6EXF6_MAIZE|nr:hypothetical protein ZEAMMB73_Zm00001d006522 [Zea mays]